MDKNELVSHVFEMLTATAVFTTLAFGWIIWRSSSWHILKHRLWRLAFGKNQHIDSNLKACIDDQSNLTAFRFHFKYVTHWPQAQMIMKWSKETGIDLGSICACGEYFDFDNFVLRKPGIRTNSARSACVIVSSIGILVAVAMILFAATPRALVSFNNTHTWLLLSTADAKVLGRSDARFLTKEDCSDSRADLGSTQFSKEQVASLCEFFNKKTASRFVSGNVEAQRVLSVSFLLVIACVLMGARLGFFHVRAAWALNAYLDMQETTERSINISRSDNDRIGEIQNPLLQFDRAKRGGAQVTTLTA